MRRLRLAPLLLLAFCASAPPADSTLRVLVYNIHAGKDAGGVENLARVADLIKSQKADIVLLQEVDRNTQRSGNVDHFAVLERLTNFHGVFGKAIDFQGGDYGIAVLSRWPIARSEVIRYHDVPQERRIALALDTNGISIMNTHLDASREDTYRMQEATQLVEAIKTRSPQLAGGDFNSTPDSTVHENMQSSGLRDLWLECGRGSELTYPADVPVKRIDYLYAAKGWSCTSAEVIETQASDHRPVLFTLRRR